MQSGKTDVKQDVADGLQRAVLQAALDGAAGEDVATAVAEKAKKDRKPASVSPRNGQPVPSSPGRTPGTKNRLTNLREAVLEAFDMVGGPQYLARLAEGTSSDRAAFVSLVSKVIPTQVDANVNGGIQVQLSWLGQRQIGTTTAQPVEQVTQVIDLERDSRGKYRIADPQTGDVAGPGGGKGPGDAQGGGE